MNASHLTVRNVPPELAAALDAQRRRRGTSLNQTVLNPALPTIVGELHGADLMLWVITVYILASTIMMPAYGKLGDLFGRKPLLLGAIGVFLVGSVVSATCSQVIGTGTGGNEGSTIEMSVQICAASVLPAIARRSALAIV